ncbi:FUSC family protein [Nocardioides acrostichi]|uniref:FUSC family protein n=1 Tax=Nocardioides acrostichi TaxID=2784339 RepID=A0A930UYK8_9ACTN|nr:FUSC family protein [Nocardioides acrostichi]MBF4162102.1 FUSC family protein [Nocardioides acrostichi]
MSPPDPTKVRSALAALDRARTRSRTSWRQRWARLRSRSWQIGQCAVAAAVAWWFAKDVAGHPAPFFAPVAAVVSLGISYGQRLQRVAEVTIGVAVGVFVSDLLIHVLGSGPWQIGLIVALAMSAALLLDDGALLVTQSAVQAIIVSTLLPSSGDAFLRWTDALIGGGVALVAATVVPRAPLRRPRERAAVVVRKVAELLRGVATGIEGGDAEGALVRLQDARATEVLVRDLQIAADEGLSVTASSPFRVRHKSDVRSLRELIEPLDLALRNTRVVVRRVAVTTHLGYPVPASYAVLARELAAAADAMGDELAAGLQAVAAQPALLEVARMSGEVERSQYLSAEVVLAQLRSIIADLLAATGMDPMEATEALPPPSGWDG